MNLNVNYLWFVESALIIADVQWPLIILIIVSIVQSDNYISCDYDYNVNTTTISINKLISDKKNLKIFWKRFIKTCIMWFNEKRFSEKRISKIESKQISLDLPGLIRKCIAMTWLW